MSPLSMNTDKARQGETGHGVRYVLIFSLSLALVALAVALATA